MITAIEIENFRGIAKGTVSGLRSLTALVGANNSGKSTILEALYVGAAKGQPAACARVATARGWVGLENVRALGYRSKRHCVITASHGTEDAAPKGTISWGGASPQLQAHSSQRGLDGRLLMVATSPEGFPVSHFCVDEHGKTTAPLADPTVLKAELVDLQAMREHETVERAYSQATSSGSRVKDDLIALCRSVRPATQNLEILNREGDYILCTLDADGSCPLQFAGDGMRRLVLIACQLAAARGGVVMIEEPECFLHPKAMDEFVRLLWAAVAQGTQVVFSTHSLELLSLVFAKSPGHDLSQACIVATRLSDGQLHTGVIDGANAAERLHDIGEDLRR
jgi:energy-coupling factor transporter ATP-binding protein EcfA2